MNMKSTDNPKHHYPTDFTVFDITVPTAFSYGDMADSAPVYDEDSGALTPMKVPGRPDMSYIPFGASDKLPYRIVDTINSDEVLSQNLFFNILTTYGAGLKYVDPTTGAPSQSPDIRRFLLSNSMSEFFMEQCTDMKYFFFCVAVLILNREGTAIVNVVHKDACYCRFEKADRFGRINHVFFANWRKNGLSKKDVEVIPLLDERDPLGDLEAQLGKAPSRDGLTKVRTKSRKFAVVMRFPTPGQRYYPVPYYMALFRGDWYDIKRLIGKGKKAKIKNHASVKYHVQVSQDYWDRLAEEAHLTDPKEIAECVKKRKEEIKNFLTGAANSGKTLISNYSINSSGHNVDDIRITVVDTSKEGGDWTEDTQEASNMLCYGTNIHPNMVGAVPGKGQSNNSGSDKRELFTLKQSLETAFHDILLKVHEVVIIFNGWADKVRPEVPMILLTTLDQHTDAVQTTADGEPTEVNS